MSGLNGEAVGTRSLESASKCGDGAGGSLACVEGMTVYETLMGFTELNTRVSRCDESKAMSGNRTPKVSIAQITNCMMDTGNPEVSIGIMKTTKMRSLSVSVKKILTFVIVLNLGATTTCLGDTNFSVFTGELNRPELKASVRRGATLKLFTQIETDVDVGRAVYTLVVPTAGWILESRTYDEHGWVEDDGDLDKSVPSPVSVSSTLIDEDLWETTPERDFYFDSVRAAGGEEANSIVEEVLVRVPDELPPGKYFLRLASVQTFDSMGHPLLTTTAQPLEVTILPTSTLTLESGWNLISSPIEPLDPLITNIFMDPEGIQLGPVWEWETDRFIIATEFHALKGYWVYVETPTEVTLDSKDDDSPTQLTLDPTWNLVGPAKDNVTVVAGESVKGSVWGFNGQHFQIETLLQVNEGYWIYASTESDLDLSEVDRTPNPFIWEGDGTPGDWSDPNNWDRNSVPTADADVIFNSIGNASAPPTTNTPTELQSITIEASYTGGHVVLAGPLSIAGNLHIDGTGGSSLQIGGHQVTVGGDVNLLNNGRVLDSADGSLEVIGVTSLTVDESAAINTALMIGDSATATTAILTDNSILAVDGSVLINAMATLHTGTGTSIDVNANVSIAGGLVVGQSQIQVAGDWDTSQGSVTWGDGGEFILDGSGQAVLIGANSSGYPAITIDQAAPDNSVAISGGEGDTFIAGTVIITTGIVDLNISTAFTGQVTVGTDGQLRNDSEDTRSHLFMNADVSLIIQEGGQFSFTANGLDIVFAEGSTVDIAGTEGGNAAFEVIGGVDMENTLRDQDPFSGDEVQWIIDVDAGTGVTLENVRISDANAITASLLAVGSFDGGTNTNILFARRWRGTGTNDWSNADNWEGGLPGPGDAVILDASSNGTPPATGSLPNIAQLIISSGYTNTPTLGGDMTVTGDIQLEGGGLNFAGNTLTAGGNLRIDGNIGDGSGVIEFTNADATLSILNGPRTIDTTIAVASGAKVTSNVTDFTTGNLVVADGGTLDLSTDAVITLTGNATIVGNLMKELGVLSIIGDWDSSGNGTVTFTDGTLIINGTGEQLFQVGSEDSFPNLRVETGSIIASGPSSSELSVNGDMTVAGDFTFAEDGISNIMGNLTVNENGSLDTNSPDRITVKGNTEIDGSLEHADGTLSLGGDLLGDSEGTFSLTGGTVNLEGRDIDLINSTYLQSGGTTSLNGEANQALKISEDRFFNLTIGSGGVTMTGATSELKVDGNLTLEAGSLTLDGGAAEIVGVTTINGLAVLDTNGQDITIRDMLSGDGTLEINGGTTDVDGQLNLTGAIIQRGGTLTVSATTVNLRQLAGGLNATGGTVQLDSGAATTLSVGADTTFFNLTTTVDTVVEMGADSEGLDVDGDLTLNAGLSLAASGMSDIGGNLRINNGAFTTNSPASIAVGGAITVDGILSHEEGPVSIGGNLDGEGTLILTGGTVSLSGAVVELTSVEYNQTGGTTVLSGIEAQSLRISDDDDFFNLTVGENGVEMANSTSGLDINGDLLLNGNLAFETGTADVGGETTVSSEASLQVQQPSTFNGAVIVGGVLDLNADTIFNADLTVTAEGELRATGDPIVIQFDETALTQVDGTIVIDGAEGNQITLRSTTPDDLWDLKLNGASQSFVDVRVSDSNAAMGDTAVATPGVDLTANNVNWTGLTPFSLTWTGAARDGDWSNPNNWNPNLALTSGAIVEFDRSGIENPSPTVNSPKKLRSINVLANYTRTSAIRITQDLALIENFVVNQQGSGVTRFNLNGFSAMISGNGIIGQLVSGGFMNFVGDGTSTLNLIGGIGLSANLVVSPGKDLRMESDLNLNGALDVSGSLTLAGTANVNGTLTISTPGILDVNEHDVTLGGGFEGDGTLLINGGTARITNPSNMTGQINQTGGTINLSATTLKFGQLVGGFNASGGTVVLNSGAATFLDVGDNTTFFNLMNDGNTPVTAFAGTHELDVDGNMTVNSKFLVDGGSAVDIAGDLTANADVTFVEGVDVNVEGDLIMNAGILRTNFANSVTVEGTTQVGVNGFIQNVRSTLNLNSAVTINGILQLNQGNTTFNDALTVAAEGTFEATNGSYIIRFDSDELTNIKGTISCRGAGADGITLRSAVDDDDWDLDLSGATQTFVNVRVKDSNVISVDFPANATGGSVDLGGNTNWIFE